MHRDLCQRRYRRCRREIMRGDTGGRRWPISTRTVGPYKLVKIGGADEQDGGSGGHGVMRRR